MPRTWRPRGAAVHVVQRWLSWKDRPAATHCDTASCAGKLQQSGSNTWVARGVKVVGFLTKSRLVVMLWVCEGSPRCRLSCGCQLRIFDGSSRRSHLRIGHWSLNRGNGTQLVHLPEVGSRFLARCDSTSRSCFVEATSSTRRSSIVLLSTVFGLTHGEQLASSGTAPVQWRSWLDKPLVLAAVQHGPDALPTRHSACRVSTCQTASGLVRIPDLLLFFRAD